MDRPKLVGRPKLGWWSRPGDNARAESQRGPMAVETGYGSYRHGCAIDNRKRSQPR